MERDKQRQIVEALILASPEPIAAARLAEILPYGKRKRVIELVRELNDAYAAEGRAFEIWEVGGGYQVRTRPEYANYVKQLNRVSALRLSRAALETLALVAYRQPVTRAEIEGVRGVDPGPILRNLIDRKLVRIAGHRDVPGRPMLYATARRFLEVFGLNSLEDLPTLRDLEELAAEVDGAAAPVGEPAPEPEGVAAPSPAAEIADAPEPSGELH
ncbi:MAG: SMC-Scp complex subunit ScpB [Deltaproteobacteria bacterium]|nr:MAG: SMC-Scp complex subunit ScpB [Deltaproteobacteria bacterium]